MSGIDKLIAQTREWIRKHKEAGREIDEAAAWIRLKALHDAKRALS